MTFTIAQIFGILGMAMNVLSYQGKEKKTLILMQFFGSLFFAVNMFMLNAIMGGLLNTIGIARALIYSNSEKFKNVKRFNLLFLLLYILSYIAIFTFFNKEATMFNLIVEVLPLIAMIATTVGFSMKKAANIRRLTLISSPSWLIYNCINFSLGGILCEVFSLVSVFIGILRYDIKKKQKKG